MQNFENKKEFWYIYWDHEKQEHVLVHKQKKVAE